MTWFKWILFAVYFPVGCLLAVSRMGLGIVVAWLTPPSLRPGLLRCLCGLVTRVPKKMDMPEKGALLLSNHSSYMDYLAVSAAVSKQREFATVAWHQVESCMQIICRPIVPVLESGKNRQFLRGLRRQLKERNVIIFPEGAVTDACTGVLQFEKSAFAFKYPLYLVAFKYHRPFDCLQPMALSTNLVFELAIELFQPWTWIEIIPIGLFGCLENESPESYATRAQKRVADELQLNATCWTRHDRHRLLFPQNEIGASGGGNSDHVSNPSSPTSRTKST